MTNAAIALIMTPTKELAPAYSRLLRKPASGVLGRTSPCDVPRGYDSVAGRPAAWLDGLSEQPATAEKNDVF